MKVSNSEQRLKELLEILNITQLELSEKTGIDPSTISLYCSGKRVPRQDKISAICDVFNVNPAWLLGYDVLMESTPEKTQMQSFVTTNERGKMMLEVQKIMNELSDEQFKMLAAYANFLKERD